MKPAYQSKLIWVGSAIAVIPWLAELSPELKGQICGICEGNSPLVASLTGLLIVYLRLKTKDPVSVVKALLLTLLITGCGALPQKLDPDKQYQKDLPLCIKDVICSEGTMVVPRLDYYEFELAPKGDAEIDMLILSTCHRELTIEKPAKSDLDFFTKWFKKKKEGFTVRFTPIPGIEDDGDCTWRIETLEKDKGRHSWSVIRQQHKKYQLPATLYCNGEIRSEVGVSLCQSKAHLTQQISFPEKVMIEPGKGCTMPSKVGELGYQWRVDKGECGYTIRSETGRLHDLLTIGYESILIRSPK